MVGNLALDAEYLSLTRYFMWNLRSFISCRAYHLCLLVLPSQDGISGSNIIMNWSRYPHSRLWLVHVCCGILSELRICGELSAHLDIVELKGQMTCVLNVRRTATRGWVRIAIGRRICRASQMIGISLSRNRWMSKDNEYGGAYITICRCARTRDWY